MLLLLLPPLLRLQAGFGDFQVTQWNGRRADAFATHLKPAMGRPNLEVRLRCSVLCALLVLQWCCAV
jgi:choline dehydrogenase-like flavoprotein